MWKGLTIISLALVVVLAGASAVMAQTGVVGGEQPRGATIQAMPGGNLDQMHEVMEQAMQNGNMQQIHDQMVQNMPEEMRQIHENMPGDMQQMHDAMSQGMQSGDMQQMHNTCQSAAGSAG